MQPETSEKICVIGAGVVGAALLTYLRAQGRDAGVYDPPKGQASTSVLAEAQTIFICVPTPYAPGRGFDDSYLLSAIGAIPGEKLVVIKSTSLPGTTDLMQNRFPQHRFAFNPEFLREATAVDDFINPDRQIVGCTERSRGDAERLMALLPPAPFELICAAAEAEMAKYMTNSFLAVKVSFANEMFDLCARLDIDYAPVKGIVAADGRIGGSHLDVFDAGYRGYGGMCLPKDSKSLLALARAAGVELQVLQATDRVNATLRPDEALTPRPLRALAASAAAKEQAA